jgi:hypothetical protein
MAVQTERQTAVQTGRQNPVLLSTVDKSSIIYNQIPLRNFGGDDKGSASLAPTAYSILADIVLSGAKDPDLEWRDYYKDSNIPIPDFDHQVY